MHGIIFKGLKDFVVEEYGQEAWHEILEEAGLGRPIYVPVTEYPDEELLDIVATASELTGKDPETLQYEFGRFLVPELVDVYGVHVDADWTGLELVENVEEYIHQGLRAKDLSEFTPPGLGAERVGDRSVVVTYGSDRQLCDVAKGILDGVADYYDEDWRIDERTCMHDGDERCELHVQAV